ncbi:MAG TPA: hypothetical protein VEZ40_10140 [Pyrinomonadaceae bacterium]|nr:hypothetical protein [Pyrinomonadaceae bacterium]
MTTVTPIQLAKMRKDLNLLRSSIEKLYVDALGMIKADEEFMRLWSLYADLRRNLIKLDSTLFGELRELTEPPTTQNAGYGDYQVADRDFVNSLYGEITKAGEYLEILEQSYAKQFGKPDTFSALRLMSQRFHQVARQLRNRYSQRPTIEVEDEYDMQDLLHALLRLNFDDIRPEEWTPSYAGKSARMDFLLKAEQVVVETKKTRKGLDAKELGDQLIIDIQRYQSHPDCKTLFCFVYDPEARIANPVGIENDLSKTYNGLDVIVQIEPK